MKSVTKIIIVTTVSVFLFQFLFGWVNANADSYFYWMIGEYFRTGTYPFTSPFIYTLPTTISPPLYGVFFIVTHGIPHADIILHGVQLILLGITSMLLYKMLTLHIKKTPAIFISSIFAILPVNLIYSSYVMTENPAQFFVTLWTYLVVVGVKTHKPHLIGISILVASIAGLMKYSLMIYMPLGIFFLLPHIKSMKRTHWIAPTFAIIILCGWMLINYRITGVIGLYDTKGTQLYNQFVAPTKLLPPEGDPSVIRMRSLLPPNTDIAVPYWDIQEKLGNSLHGVWRDIDTVLYNVAWTSVRTHPMQYVIHSIKNFARMHYDNLPHWKNIGNMGRIDVTGTNAPYCSKLDAVQMCDPVINTPWSYPVWNAFIRIELMLFAILSPLIFYLLLLPSLLIALVWGNKHSFIYTLIYLSGVIPIAFTIHVDPRYIVPFYPVAVLVIITSGKIAVQKYKDITKTNW